MPDGQRAAPDERWWERRDRADTADPAAAQAPDDRLRPVLNVVHLLFAARHTAPSGPSLVRADLVERAMDLTRMLRELMPGETEVRGLYALLQVTDARRATRTDKEGRLIRLEDQDRSRWDRAALAEAETLITGCLRAARPGRNDEAAGAYRRALELTANEAERAFLAGRLAALGPRE